MPAYRLRAATLKDLPTLVAHRRRMFQDMGSPFTRAEYDAADPVYRAWARMRLKNGLLGAFIVEHKGEAVASGCVWLQPVQPRPGAPGGRFPYLLSMYTLPAHRGHGLATRIVRAAMKWAAARGYARMSLHASKQGRTVYQALGFERTWEMRGGTKAARRREPQNARPRRFGAALQSGRRGRSGSMRTSKAGTSR